MDELMLDGNAVAGMLQEVFAVEMTTAIGTCGSCGAAERGGGDARLSAARDSSCAARTATTHWSRLCEATTGCGSTSRASEPWKSPSSRSSVAGERDRDPEPAEGCRGYVLIP